MIVATVAHFAVFAFWPEMTAEDVSVNSDELEAIELPPEIEIPPPPEAIARPATPVIAAADIDEDITIAPTTFEDNPVEDLPPPPEEVTTTDISAAPTFTPYTVRPDIKNRAEVARALEREYPPLLRDAGIGGTVQVWFFIDEQGAVSEDAGERVLRAQGSGRCCHQGGRDHPVHAGPEPGQDECRSGFLCPLPSPLDRYGRRGTHDSKRLASPAPPARPLFLGWREAPWR